MLEQLVEIHASLPLGPRILFDFLFFQIFVRGIIANTILDELKERGIIKPHFLHGLVDKIKRWKTIARKLAIVQHYREDHGHESVVGCGQGRCAVFAHA